MCRVVSVGSPAVSQTIATINRTFTQAIQSYSPAGSTDVPMVASTETSSSSSVGVQKPKKKSTVLEQRLREQYSQIRDIPFWRPKALNMEEAGKGQKSNHVIGLTLSKRQLNKFYKWY